MSATERVLQRLLTRQVASSFNYCGRGNKLAFKDFKLCDVVHGKRSQQKSLCPTKHLKSHWNTQTSFDLGSRGGTCQLPNQSGQNQNSHPRMVEDVALPETQGLKYQFTIFR